MRDSENRYIMLFGISPVSFGLMLLIFVGMFLISCDEVERHKTLSFFFDGVPPLGTEVLQEEFLDANSPEKIQTGRTNAWYVHEPRKDCSNCHSSRRQRSFSSQIYLTAPVPELCYNCHNEYAKSSSYVHGPVAVGQCLFCHNPHKSKIEHLLTVSEPGLCYLCHDVDTIELITAHSPEKLSTCTNCHNAHASSNKALLKDNSLQKNNQYVRHNTPLSDSQEHILIIEGQDEQQESEQQATVTTTLSESKSLSEVFLETSRLIEQNQLQQAWEYLNEFKGDSSFSAEERAQITRVLGMIDSVITQNQRRLEDNNDTDKRAREIAELYYGSMAYYRSGQLVKAREGFVKILDSGLIPESMANTIRDYISDIDKSLTGNNGTKRPEE